MGNMAGMAEDGPEGAPDAAQAALDDADDAIAYRAMQALLGKADRLAEALKKARNEVKQLERRLAEAELDVRSLLRRVPRGKR